MFVGLRLPLRFELSLLLAWISVERGKIKFYGLHLCFPDIISQTLRLDRFTNSGHLAGDVCTTTIA